MIGRRGTPHWSGPALLEAGWNTVKKYHCWGGRPYKTLG